MSGIRDTNVRQKLLAITPFPELKTVVNICRSEESAMKDSTALESKVVVDKISNKKNKPKYNQENNRYEKCGKCGYQSHDKKLTKRYEKNEQIFAPEGLKKKQAR